MTSDISKSQHVGASELNPQAAQPQAAPSRSSRPPSPGDRFTISDWSRASATTGTTQNQVLAAVDTIRTADKGLEHVSALTTKMRQLAVRASDARLSEADRASLNHQFGRLREQVGQLAASPPVSSGIRVATRTREASSSSESELASRFKGDSKSPGVNGASLDSTGSATKAVASIDAALQTVNTTREHLGTTQNQLQRSLETGPPPT